jgi:hypothetical protein
MSAAHAFAAGSPGEVLELIRAGRAKTRNRESVYQRSSPPATRDLRILASRLGPRAGVVGLTTLALEHVLDPAGVDALLARRGLAA